MGYQIGELVKYHGNIGVIEDVAIDLLDAYPYKNELYGNPFIVRFDDIAQTKALWSSQLRSV